MLSDADFDQVCGGISVPGNQPPDAGLGLGNAIAPDRGNVNPTHAGNANVDFGYGYGVITAVIIGAGNPPL
jgi:hypothetical protein